MVGVMRVGHPFIIEDGMHNDPKILWAKISRCLQSAPCEIQTVRLNGSPGLWISAEFDPHASRAGIWPRAAIAKAIALKWADCNNCGATPCHVFGITPLRALKPGGALPRIDKRGWRKTRKARLEPGGADTNHVTPKPTSAEIHRHNPSQGERRRRMAATPPPERARGG